MTFITSVSLVLIVILAWIWPPEVPRTSAVPYGVGIIAFSYFLWLSMSQIYLRTGKGRKIGIAFKGYRTHKEDLQLLRDGFDRLTTDSAVHDHFSIRLLPISFFSSRKKANGIMKRYGFDVMMLASIEEGTNANDYVFHLEIGASGFSIPKEIFDSTMQLVKAVMSHQVPVRRRSEFLNFASDKLFNVVLFHITAIDFFHGKFEQSYASAKHLDNRLALVVYDTKEFTRTNARFIAMNSCALLARRITEENKSPDSHRIAEAMYNELIDGGYADEYPMIYHNKARSQFYLNRLEDAIRSLELVDLSKLNGVGKSHICLGLGVLHLFNACWDHSAQNYQMLVKDIPSARMIEWTTVNSFLNDAFVMGHPGIEYLRALYHGIQHDGSIPPDLMQSALQWVHQDASRRPLRAPLERVNR